MPVPRDRSTIEEIDRLVKKTFTSTEVTKHVNKNNSDHSILFEAIKLTMCMGEHASKENIRTSILMLVKFTGVKEPNIRYIALETLSKAQPLHLLTCPNILSENLNLFLSGLKEPDISIRKSAVDSLFTLATSETSSEIINEFLDHLQEQNDFQIMEEMVLKVAILAEKFAVNLSWYIDVIIKLIEFAGDYTSDDLWFRVAQMVTGFASDSSA